MDALLNYFRKFLKESFAYIKDDRYLISNNLARIAWDYFGKFFTGFFLQLLGFFESGTLKYKFGCMPIVKNNRI